ncbi:Polysaccharide biosynthesis protein [Hyphomicrobium sulfonivorans]|uniref:Polysaccharide biosynthesis protein n=1 Tax=Hyphomicrobium sulfonivorans TaxID=121290 RepID=A0A109BLI5_HYPSL|nr:hypothetical protein [Hyphomicrobium sulfonivorans]KWT70999.1 Polysaccharide biosynthesis protein [Hyphomicrobium sulfonivorans]
MIGRHIALYFGSKGLAAIVNVVTMAVFVRIGGADTYGGFVLFTAIATIVYGVAMQWLRFSFFACYREDAGGNGMIAAYLLTQLVGLTLVGAGLWLATAFGFITATEAVGVGILVAGLACYDAMHEIARTRLHAGIVAVGVLVRSFLMIALGVAAIVMVGTALSLALAVGIAHIGAALALSASIWRMGTLNWQRSDMQQLLMYGRPLVPAFGFEAAGNQLDRLLLARLGDLAETGRYGAVSDLFRQLLIVAAEAIAGAYMAIARKHVIAGDRASAGEVLGQAFLAYVALLTFIPLGFLQFSAPILDLVFGADLRVAVEPALPLIIAASVVAVLRGYYFGQVVHILQHSRLLLVSTALHAATVLVIGVLAIPQYGMAGAAAALLLGNVVGCAAFLIAWRDNFVMRLPYGSAAVMVGLGLAAYFVSGFVAGGFENAYAGLACGIVIFAIAALIAARRYNLLSFNALVDRITKRVAA